MLFWIIALLLTLLVGAVLAAAALRPPPAEAGAADVDVYRDQLKEVERDLTRSNDETIDRRRRRDGNGVRALDVEEGRLADAGP